MTLLPRLALGLVLALLVIFGLFRIDPVDVPGHLRTGQLIWEQGAPLTTNQFSWTFPDYPVAQQYPLYQLVLYGLQQTLGWWSLSVFCCASWVAAGLAWMRWAGGLPMAQRTVMLWLFAVLGVQRHLVARPEVFTLLGLALLLLAFDAWRQRPSLGPLAAIVATLWAMANLHQMYVVGLVLVAGFAVHVVLTRALADRGWLDATDRALPLGPLLATLGAGLLAVTLSPLGFGAWTAPWALVTTVGSLGTTGRVAAESAELEPIWTDPIGAFVTVALLAVVAVQAWRTRGRWQVIELGVLAMGVGMVAVALRGVPFFALAAASVATRWERRAPVPLVPAGSVVPTVASAVAFVAAGALGLAMLAPTPHVYLQRQHGLGRSIGEWGDSLAAFLREHPPPGEMLNIGWGAANYLTYGVYPVRRVFVDGRWEAYPKPFLTDCMRMQREPEVLDRMIAEWAPGFVVAELRDPNQQDQLARLVQAGWSLVHVDSIAAVAVRPSEQAEVVRYVAAHQPTALDVGDWLPDHPVLHAQQQIRVAGLLRRLGELERAEALRTAAAEVDHPSVAADLERFR